MHSPDVTTSVSSSVQCGFSGGMIDTLPCLPPDRDLARRPAGYPRRVPEMIEVERYRSLAASTLGRPIAAVDSPDTWFLKGEAEGALLSGVLVGNRFVAARRIGKLLLLDVDDGPVIGLRFGMTGTLLVDGDDAVGRPPVLAHPARPGVGPLVGDVRRRRPDGGPRPPSAGRRLARSRRVGTRPRCRRRSAPAGLAAALAGSSTPLKARLLDQSRIAGIGNLIADEVLWRAGLSPLRPAGSLSPSRCAGCTATWAGRSPTSRPGAVRTWAT